MSAKKPTAAPVAAVKPPSKSGSAAPAVDASAQVPAAAPIQAAAAAAAAVVAPAVAVGAAAAVVPAAGGGGKNRCHTCGGGDFLYVNGHCNDTFTASFRGAPEYNGYVPRGLGIGGGDDVDFSVCIACGSIRGWHALTKAKVVQILSRPDDEDADNDDGDSGK